MASKKKVVKKKVSKKKVAKKKVAKKKDTWKNPEGAFSPENRTHLEMMVGMVAERPELMEKVRVGGSLFVMKTMGLSLHDAQVFAREIKHLHNENLKKQREEEKQTKKKRAKKKVARKKAAKRTMGGDDVSQSKPLPQQIFDKPEKGKVCAIAVKHPPMSREMKMEFIVRVVWENVGRFSQGDLFLSFSDDPKTTFILGGEEHRLHYVAGYLTCLWETQNANNYGVAYYTQHKESPPKTKGQLSATVISNANLSFWDRLAKLPNRDDNPGTFIHIWGGRVGTFSLHYRTTNDGWYLGLVEFDGEYIGHQRARATDVKNQNDILFSLTSYRQNPPTRFVKSNLGFHDTLEKGRTRRKTTTTRKKVSKKTATVRKAKKKVVKKKKSNVLPFRPKKKR